MPVPRHQATVVLPSLRPGGNIRKILRKARQALLPGAAAQLDCTDCFHAAPTKPTAPTYTGPCGWSTAGRRSSTNTPTAASGPTTSRTSCPFDLKAPVIELRDEDFGIWYLDAMENPDKYRGKHIHFKAYVCQTKRAPKGCFVAGRFGMTCCAEDISFIGVLCEADNAAQLGGRDGRTGRETPRDLRRRGPLAARVPGDAHHAPRRTNWSISCADKKLPDGCGPSGSFHFSAQRRITALIGGKLLLENTFNEGVL